jgi:hypothetical protein
MATDEFLKQYEKLPKAEQEKADLSALAKRLEDDIKRREPYCVILEGCVLGEFKSPECRPPMCPFQDRAACRYLTSCLFKSMKDDYAKAMGVTREEQAKAPKKDEPAAAKAEKKKGFWGF